MSLSTVLCEPELKQELSPLRYLLDMGFPIDGGCHVSYTGSMIIVSTMFVDGIVPCTLMIEFEDFGKKRL